jgi:malonyl-CoA O-methyltransferase
MRVLSPAQGYALWAPAYAETVVTVLESAALESLGVPLTGRRLLDAGCGTGRRLARARQAGASVAVGVDLTPEMLAQAHGEPLLAAADVRALPVADGAFDVVWCRLVLGHVADLEAAYAELGRCCAAGGALVVTDFHPAAAEAGHRRTFRDARGEVVELEHHVHRAGVHRGAAARAGLSLRQRRDCAVGDTVRDLYAQAGRLDMYERQRGLPLVLALVFERAE